MGREWLSQTSWVCHYITFIGYFCADSFSLLWYGVEHCNELSYAVNHFHYTIGNAPFSLGSTSLTIWSFSGLWTIHTIPIFARLTICHTYVLDLLRF